MKLLEDEGQWDTQSNQQWGDTHLVYPANSFVVYKDEIQSPTTFLMSSSLKEFPVGTQ